MTFRELFREFEAARRRQEYDNARDVTVAWHTVRLWVVTKSKKQLPSLKSQLELNGRRANGRQSAGQIRNVLSVLSEQYGIPLRKAKPRG